MHNPFFFFFFYVVLTSCCFASGLDMTFFVVVSSVGRKASRGCTIYFFSSGYPSLFCSSRFDLPGSALNVVPSLVHKGSIGRAIRFLRFAVPYLFCCWRRVYCVWPVKTPVGIASSGCTTFFSVFITLFFASRLYVPGMPLT